MFLLFISCFFVIIFNFADISMCSLFKDENGHEFCFIMQFFFMFEANWLSCADVLKNHVRKERGFEAVR